MQKYSYSKLLDGIRILEIKKNVDERGFFGEIFRKDWKELFGEDDVVQTNLSVSYPGTIRAWHRHRMGQVDYFLAIQGAIKLCAYDDKTNEISEIISSEEKLQLVRIPGHYWHGFKAIGDKRVVVIYFVNRLYDYKSPDEDRRPWNDPEVVDSRTNTSFDWNRPPYK